MSDVFETTIGTTLTDKILQYRKAHFQSPNINSPEYDNSQNCYIYSSPGECKSKHAKNGDACYWINNWDQYAFMTAAVQPNVATEVGRCYTADAIMKRLNNNVDKIPEAYPNERLIDTLGWNFTSGEVEQHTE